MLPYTCRKEVWELSRWIDLPILKPTASFFFQKSTKQGRYHFRLAVLFVPHVSGQIVRQLGTGPDAGVPFRAPIGTIGHKKDQLLRFGCLATYLLQLLLFIATAGVHATKMCSLSCPQMLRYFQIRTT